MNLLRIIMVIIMNKICITATVIIIVSLVIGVTTYKVLDEHNDKLIEVEEKYIIETAKTCLNEKKCSGNEITLQTLYDLDYLETEADPVTKEYYNPESYVKIDGVNEEFIVVR